MNVFRVSKLSQNSFCVRCTDTTYVLRSATYTYQAMFFELECVWKHCNGACVDLCFSCAGRQGSIMYIVNPWRACAARVIVVVLCVCVCACVRACVRACVCVCPLISAASLIGITQQRYQRVHSNTAFVLNFADFPKNASFKSYGVICLPRIAPASKSFSPQEISFYASVKPIATFSLLRQRACGRQRAIRWHRLVKRHRYTDHEYK